MSPTRPQPSRLQVEMGQIRPFKSPRQEAVVGLLRTASVVTRAFARVVEQAGLSWAQYNALRVIQGAGSAGIPTLAIRERMIDEGTTITRLLDKLEAAGLIQRERSDPDRRQVLCRATEAGRKLLRELDPRVDALDEEVAGTLGAAQLRALNTMLAEIRSAAGTRGAAR